MDDELMDDDFEQLSESNLEQQQEEELNDYIDSLLRERGIEDKNKIIFENEDGEPEEKAWDNLTNEDKYNILKTTEVTPETELDDTEIQLINAIRTSGLTPSEFLNYVGQQGVNNYVQNNFQPTFEVDQYSDDELFLMDLMSKAGDLTDEEAALALENAKANETLYLKQVDALRKEYQDIEAENQQQVMLEEEEAAQQQYELFSNLIVDGINNLTELQGYDLNLADEDKQEIYDFITGTDAAGNNYFAKALSDPDTLVKAAWLTLNADNMVDEITQYFTQEIKNVRKASYEKGYSDAQNKMPSSVYIPKNEIQTGDLDDLDSF